MWHLAVIDDEVLVCKRLARALTKDGYDVQSFTSAGPFLKAMERSPFHVVVTDLRLPDMNGLNVLTNVKKRWPGTEVIVITGYGSIENAVAAMKAGAYHYVTKPVRLSDIRHLTKGAVEKVAMRRENERLRRALGGGDPLSRIVGKSQPIQRVFDLVHKVAPLDCTVLIEGQSGTGKELVARAIHGLSPRASRPFIAFNCGGFTEELITSELFGYEKGAFTGATTTKVGLMESAMGGTVFLDEIGEMPLTMQVKLLHVLQEKRILRVGGTRPIALDIRIIAATNKDLKQEVTAGRFREDLYYRLNVVRIPLPTLAARREDIPVLVAHFIGKYRALFGKPVEGIRPQALDILKNHSFPGNVRELENIIERAVALTEKSEITVEDLPEDLRDLEVEAYGGEALLPIHEVEKRHIQRVLAATGHNKNLAAQILEMPRTTLWRKMKRYGLHGTPPGDTPS
ncbi:DNA-binding transcriptional response regulator, NtrC family, contains REC, AAA-type ATPase, and a Fis-type DNA-binding domains [Desulfacinum hydrothermale DSM 13146]|uniref:DNA-binding transcriptional response regulator, NtrC family, contains REC, AAA-type ATPase, and a Fis-type DNA-binding domains n=1 Tax=Desulfacinum hydrothermale DSM 13146 TaxID=1121390 RepID=A0A1W1WY56_9BACT|nr:DNA-binding transcriptional response regulator, NtrC family, contains REC, AAA-type ATPase, and a Fis-type DNA-binding domains [Desulfacinum hydrothermale DSM 13146]